MMMMKTTYSSMLFYDPQNHHLTSHVHPFPKVYTSESVSAVVPSPASWRGLSNKAGLEIQYWNVYVPAML